MMKSAANHGGGRHSCCQRGMCALHLAEDRPGRNLTSTIHLGRSIAVVPNYDGQELASAFTLAAIEARS